MNWMVRVCLILITFQASLFTASAANRYGYTDQQPLVIASDWDFQPFEFLNADGQPSGYNIEILDLILTKMEIPHKFVMREWHTVNEMFAKHEADLIHAMSNYFKSPPYCTTKKYINYYTLRTARHIDTPPLNSFHHLEEYDTLLLKEDDYAALVLKTMGQQPFHIEYTSPKTALSRIHSSHAYYFVWGELPLKRKIKELHIDSIALDEIDLPPGELHIIGYDQDIISLIDDEYTRMEQAGEIQPIYDKWFHPELQHHNASPYALYILLGAVVVLIIGFLLSHLITIRVNKAVRHGADLNTMMTQALNMGDYHIVICDLRTRIVKNVHGGLLPPNGILFDEFVDRMDPELREEYRIRINAMMNDEVDHWTMEGRWNSGTKENPDWQSYYGSAILERENGRPRYIIHAIKNVTDDLAEEAHNQELAAKYKLLFDTNILAMAFYDKNGHLLESNQKMRQLSITGKGNEQYFHETNLFDLPGFKDINGHTSREPFHASTHLQMKNINLDRYVENRLVPLFDDDDQLLFYIVTSRDVTVERQLYMQLREHEHQLVKANEAIRRYDRQLSYLLEECKIFIWRYDPKTDIINISYKPHMAEYTMSLNEFMEGVPKESRAAGIIKLREFIAKKKPFSTIYQYCYKPLRNEVSWFTVGGMPTFDENGQLKEFFGMARDITQIMEAQELLRKETTRAEDSGKLKSAFLANMTHEIRTPLNAIVGFSELLQMVDTAEERLEFIRIIRNNCDMLLRLINDILEASNMGQSLTIEPKEVDLSRIFDDICLSLQQRVQEPGVTFIKDNPYPTYTAVLDSGRLQQLLTNFVTNAVKYTHEGHIRVGYREENGGLLFYCEDTGAGIPKEKQARVFERFVKLNDFVQGTGLGLSICHAIVKKCGGRIGVESKGEGYGSTFWFWIPREIKV